MDPQPKFLGYSTANYSLCHLSVVKRKLSFHKIFTQGGDTHQYRVNTFYCGDRLLFSIFHKNIFLYNLTEAGHVTRTPNLIKFGGVGDETLSFCRNNQKITLMCAVQRSYKPVKPIVNR
ncbi:hypothetical protein SDC9_148513 [bioreactor metagenome]|uniref:Uncharacterized protein n=1 Tax=bioreactor metagenome TaxID=1076179 RepID=A0A645EKS4_9ZZZZ